MFCAALSRVATLTQDKCTQLQQDAHNIAKVVHKRFLKNQGDQWQELVRSFTEGTGKKAFRYVKNHEQVLVRPFTQIPIEARAAERRSYWETKWGTASGPTKSEEQLWKYLRKRALQQVAEQKPLSSAQIKETLKCIPNKKGGPDGVSFQVLKNLPQEAFSGLTFLLQSIEKEGQWPQQIILVQVAMLPKSSTVERPISLTHVVYRLWAKMRKYLVDRWLLEDRQTAFWDNAVKHNTCLQVSLLRLIRAETAKGLNLHQVSVLLDFSNFYDKIDHDLLIQEALELGFPPMILYFALMVHKGPRVLVAETVASEPIQPKNGILAGCPFGVVFSKLVLWTLMAQVQRTCKPQTLVTWVDDISADVQSFTPEGAAKRAVQVYLELKNGLKARGLEVSLGKTGFLASSLKAKHALSKELKKIPQPPQIRDVLKDLGVDSTLGRRRRLPTLGKRLIGAKARLARIRQLPRDSRKKYVHASAFAAGFWGQAAMGMPKQKLHRWRIHIAKTQQLLMGHGSVEVAMALNVAISDDPWYTVRKKQFQTWVKLVQNLGKKFQTALQRAWAISWQRLTQAKHHWMITAGPLAATQAVLLDMGWKAPSIHVWTNDQGEKFEVDWYNSKLWSDLKIHLESSLLRQQITKIAQQPGAKGLGGPLDIAFHLKFLRHSFTKGLGPFVQTLWQGALQHASNSAQQVCVHCGAENTLKHQLWDCSWVNERHKPVPAVWQPHVGDESQQHFWLRGLLPSSWTQQDYTDDQLVRTGIFTQPTFDASLFVFGSDGSGGPFPRAS